ncbi:MAG: carbohydrate kinase family protein [Lachnospiraceae bacterium]
MSKKMIVAGHICLDITPVFSSNSIKPISQVLIPGKLVEMKDVSVSTGGAVANTGLGLKILGANVTLMGKVGTDEFGSIVCNILKKYDALEGMLVSPENSTSYTVVLTPPGTDRIFLHNPGANSTFSYTDLDFALIQEAELFHLGYPPIMKKLYENEGADLVHIFQRIKELHVLTSLDMATIDPESEAGQVNWIHILQKVLPYVDFFVPSIEELGFMLDRKLYDTWLERAEGQDITSVISIEEDVKPLAEQLLQWGAKVVLIKCGAPGMFFKTASKDVLLSMGEQFTSWADKEVFEESYLPEQVLSGTGAGDTSIAAFLKAVLDGYSYTECLQLAAGTGASCVAAYDALSGLKTFEELREKIANGWEKQHLIKK